MRVALFNVAVLQLKLDTRYATSSILTMTRNAARSLPAAERRALAGENESQDSQEKLLFLIQEHGIGVVRWRPCTSSTLPVLANDS